jgi:hypothetical protein
MFDVEKYNRPFLLELDPVVEAERRALLELGKRLPFGRLPIIKVRPEGINFFKNVEEWQDHIEKTNHSPESEFWEDQLVDIWLGNSSHSIELSKHKGEVAWRVSLSGE